VPFQRQHADLGKGRFRQGRDEPGQVEVKPLFPPVFETMEMRMCSLLVRESPAIPKMCPVLPLEASRHHLFHW